ncbi:uncharacterized protein LOC130693600 isoform X2 [Daphnia carinata]|uniref:uncharacterized protein LOC130693600 isoform X2 n=1 Tax=Daphnia carinata TaxID=120202 RepID=UPI00257C193D|nr:uncharacterized protein LOC130693600 isoform X2 [Daphnia carinata]
MAADEQPKLEQLLFQGKKLDCKTSIFGGGCWGLLFDGHWREKNENRGTEKDRVKSKAPSLKKEVAVRRIKNEDCLDGWKAVADKLIEGKELNHNNVLRVFGYEEDVANGWRYFALEPYTATLYDYCDYEYKGPMPNESQVLYQITSGIYYLHGKEIIHGDLNPLNVVITAQSRPVRMKISDFRLNKFSYSKNLSERKEKISWEMELCKRKYWTLSEKTDSLEGIEDATEDAIAAGCILFYYLTRGEHPFGDDFKSILKNLKETNPINLESLRKDHFAHEPIKKMIIPSPVKGFNWLHIANEKFKDALSIQVNTSKLLGNGTYGHVYEGKFNGDLVAVKQMTTTTSQKEIIQREMSTHIGLDHVNVVKLLDVADSADNRITQLVLEWCAGTLADYCEKKYNGPELPPDELVLYQIANGLHYIHSRELVHRDIKPENILISRTTPIQMKVSDLSFVKKTRHDIFSQSKIRGTLQWMAPERLQFLNDPDNMPADLPDATIKSDTYSSGCVFFYFLTRGKHPFGNNATAPANILTNNPVEFVKYKEEKSLVVEDVNGKVLVVIQKMIKFEETKRIGLDEVIKEVANLLYENKDKIQSRLRHVDMDMDNQVDFICTTTEPILACISKKELTFYTRENSSIPFSNWKKKVICLPQNIDGGSVISFEWNIDGTQLAAASRDTLVVWNYPEGKIRFQKKFSHVHQIEWNPTRHNLLATFGRESDQVVLWDSATGDVITTIDSERVTAVKWISENQIAVSSYNGTIKIFEMDENNLTTTRLVKEFKHGREYFYLKWNEKTHFLTSGGDFQIKIWSMDRDEPIYSLSIEKEISAFAWRPCPGNGEEEGGIKMASKSATLAYRFNLEVNEQRHSIAEAKRKAYEKKKRKKNASSRTIEFANSIRFPV